MVVISSCTFVLVQLENTLGFVFTAFLRKFFANRIFLVQTAFQLGNDVALANQTTSFTIKKTAVVFLSDHCFIFFNDRIFCGKTSSFFDWFFWFHLFLWSFSINPPHSFFSGNRSLTGALTNLCQMQVSVEVFPRSAFNFVTAETFRKYKFLDFHEICLPQKKHSSHSLWPLKVFEIIV